MQDKQLPKLSTTIFRAGLLVGTFDISIALIQFYLKTGKDPAIVLKYISSAVVGSVAFAGGIEMSALGLLIHFIIAFGWTIIFFWLYPRFSFLRINNVLTAIVYGMFVWAMMERVLVPLTHASQQPFEIGRAATAASILSVAIGFPLAVFARRYYAGK